MRGKAGLEGSPREGKGASRWQLGVGRGNGVVKKEARAGRGPKNKKEVVRDEDWSVVKALRRK